MLAKGFIVSCACRICSRKPAIQGSVVVFVIKQQVFVYEHGQDSKLRANLRCRAPPSCQASVDETSFRWFDSSPSCSPLLSLTLLSLIFFGGTFDWSVDICFLTGDNSLTSLRSEPGSLTEEAKEMLPWKKKRAHPFHYPIFNCNKCTAHHATCTVQPFKTLR